MAEMKAQMRQSMSNIKVYGDDPQLNTIRSPSSRLQRQSISGLEKKLASGSPRVGAAGSPKRRGSPRAAGSPRHGGNKGL